MNYVIYLQYVQAMLKKFKLIIDFNKYVFISYFYEEPKILIKA